MIAIPSALSRSRTAALLLAAVLLPSSPPVLAGPMTPALTPPQRQQFGITLSEARATQGAWQAYPAEIVVPPSQQRVVATPVPGLVEALAVDVGDTVRAGQWLARVRSAQPQELRRDVLQSGSQLDLARRQLERDEALFKEGLIPQSRLDAARAQVQQAQALSDERRAALQTSTAGTPIRSDGTLALNAPADGQVVELLVQVGQRVEAMTPLYRLVSLNPLWVALQVPARDAATVRLGDRVNVQPTDSTAQPAIGRVTAVAPQVDARSQTRTVRARLENAGGGWQPGQLVQARLQRDGTAQAVQIPVDALMPTLGNRHQVFVARPGDRFELVDVQLLTRDGSQVTLSGLPAGSQVVSRGTAALKALLPR